MVDAFVAAVERQLAARGVGSGVLTTEVR